MASPPLHPRRHPVDGRSVSVTATLATDGGMETAEAEIQAECLESGS